MTEIEFKKLFDEIVEALTEKGYDPYNQITGYLETDLDTYITRHGDARNKIKLLDKNDLKKQITNVTGGILCITEK